MDFNEFVLKAQEDLAAALPGKVITRESVDKLQGASYEGLAVRQEGSNVAAMLNMDEMYDALINGVDYNQVLSEMIRQYVMTSDLQQRGFTCIL